MTDGEIEADNARAHLLYVLLQLASTCVAHADSMPCEVLDALRRVRTVREEYSAALLNAAAGAAGVTR